MMLTTKEAAEVWCPMVRIARHEVTEKTFASNPRAETAIVRTSHIVGGCNSDALGRKRVPASCCCIADKCSMWRWNGEVHMPERRNTQAWWPDEDYAKVEPPRPATVPAFAAWIPLTGEGEDVEGGYWEEPQARVDAEYAKAMADAKAVMRGYCGLAGKPV